MHAEGVKRLIFISSMGIYNEVPGQNYRRVLDPYRDSAAVIEASDLDYTILRPGWLPQDEPIDYQITQKGEAFKGHDGPRTASRTSSAGSRTGQRCTSDAASVSVRVNAALIPACELLAHLAS